MGLIERGGVKLIWAIGILLTDLEAPTAGANSDARRARVPNNLPVVVLVVEDDPLVLLSTADTIESAGYHALQAGNADEAMALLEMCPDIRIIFTDIEMPGSMDGVKLAACVRERWPPVAIIVTSGRIPASDIVLPIGSLFLPKPYRPQELIACLSSLA
jgi:CheY-like chemotaxis protein